MPKSFTISLVFLTLLSLGACDRMSRATPQERVGYLRELVRARTVASDTIPIDGCSVERFMDDVPAWRDSLLPAERAKIVDIPPCAAVAVPVHGRFVLTEWHKNWSGEYVIRGASFPWDLGYRFTDGIFVGREQLDNQAYYAGKAERQANLDTAKAVLRGDSIRRAGTVADTADTRDSIPTRTPD
ncbi:MAG: hypothetical protein V4813_19390 [Gemmatimonadota bacterium]